MLQKRRGFVASRALATSACFAIWWWSATVALPSVVSFLFLPFSPSRTRSLSRSHSSWSTAVCEMTTSTSTSTSASISTDPSWLDKGLILSSFTDGLKSNPPAVDWLMHSLVDALWKEEQERIEIALKDSNLVSPCNGPDPVLLEQLEKTDRVVDESSTPGDSNTNSNWKHNLELLLRSNTDVTPIDLRVLYIPTAMYSLRPGSTSKPGKQRGRNRADGKKRRNEILGLLQGELEGFLESSDSSDEPNSKLQLFTVRTVTLDLDDASVKQPEEVVVGLKSDSEDHENFTADGARFPESGKEAIREWKPHLVYVQGGNTFWLHHCMEKGDWAKDLTDACCCDSSNSNANGSSSSFSTVYCGVSAGAILAGESMQTACWKGWDDPSVVPEKETYGDWVDTMGLVASGRISWFPHMTEEWEDLAERKTKELIESMSSGAAASSESSASAVCSIRDDQAYAVDGRTRSITEL